MKHTSVAFVMDFKLNKAELGVLYEVIFLNEILSLLVLLILLIILNCVLNIWNNSKYNPSISFDNYSIGSGGT